MAGLTTCRRRHAAVRDLLRNPDARRAGEIAWRIGMVLGRPTRSCSRSASRRPTRAGRELESRRRAARVRGGVLQPRQPVAGLGRAAKTSLGGTLLRCCTAAVSPSPLWLWWRDHAQSIGVLRRRRSARAVKTVRRLLYFEIVKAVVFVAAAFLSLFFFSTSSARSRAPTRGLHAADAPLRCLLLQPSHLYELSPIAVLIRTIYALASLAHRRSSRSCAPAAWARLRAGDAGQSWARCLPFTFVVGDYVAPATEALGPRNSRLLRRLQKLDRAGAWLRTAG